MPFHATPHPTIANIDDTTYQLLTQTITMGFPTMKNYLPNAIISFWEAKEQPSVPDNIILMDDCLVIPNNLRKSTLRALYSAHQGVSSMKSRANAAIYWPDVNNNIRNLRYTCHFCNEIAPQQPKEPIILTPIPQYQFQQACADYFEMSGHITYQLTADFVASQISTTIHLVRPLQIRYQYMLRYVYQLWNP